MTNLCMSTGASKTPMLERFCMCISDRILLQPYSYFFFNSTLCIVETAILIDASIDVSDESVHVYRLALDFVAR